MYATFTYTCTTPLKTEDGLHRAHFQNPLTMVKQLLMTPALTPHILSPKNLLCKAQLGFMHAHVLAALRTPNMVAP